MSDDLISRAEAIDVIRSMTISLGGKEIFHPEAKKSVLGALDDLPAVDAEPVRHGRWIYRGDYVTTADGSLDIKVCSVCNAEVTIDHYDDYCPHCGAMMDLEEENERISF